MYINQSKSNSRKTDARYCIIPFYSKDMLMFKKIITERVPVKKKAY